VRHVVLNTLKADLMTVYRILDHLMVFFEDFIRKPGSAPGGCSVKSQADKIGD
jgi:hypothetical protein